MRRIYDFPMLKKIWNKVFWKRNTIIRLQQEIENQKTQLQLFQAELVKQKQQEQERINTSITEATNKLLCNQKWIKELNRVASGIPTVWGSEERLHISPLAAVYSCLFNTNSGEITVGDYTFAGSNVSVLAGSHDMYLQGVLRRDVEFHSGCDIIIGAGVWLGSNCTVLGPCTIGDNAVVAAGAVVVPGTVIDTNSVYAGIPAKKIKEISTENGIEGEHIQNALKREQGILYVNGFSEKRIIQIDKQDVSGHWIIANKAFIYTDSGKIDLLLHKNVDGKAEILIICGQKKQNIVLLEKDEKVSFILEGGKNSIIELYSNMWGIDTVFVTACN